MAGKRAFTAAVGLAIVIAVGALSGGVSARRLPRDPIHKIKHVVIIMQENRSFDSYFGTYPGAEGIPMRDGQPLVCLPDPATHGCDPPYHNPNDVNGGGPHGH